MAGEHFTHVGFSDESNWNTGQFRSLSLATASAADVPELQRELRTILDGSETREFKWKNLRGAKERFAALRVCEYALDRVCAGQLRIDVLVWDVLDGRHRVKGRDDIANLERMYYHLFRNVLRARWPDGASWRLHPDENTALHWNTVRDYLDCVSTTAELESPLLGDGSFSLRLRQEFCIVSIDHGNSLEHPLLQLADLFAGLGVFSRRKYEGFLAWERARAACITLFHDEGAGERPSQSEAERFPVLKWLNDECKRRKLGVSLREKRGLWTPDPRNPVNFWVYEPQHPADRAPTRMQAG